MFIRFQFIYTIPYILTIFCGLLLIISPCIGNEFYKTYALNMKYITNIPVHNKLSIRKYRNSKTYNYMYQVCTENGLQLFILLQHLTY